MFTHLPITFETPVQLFWLLLIPGIVLLAVRSLSSLERPRRILAMVTRSLVVMLLTFCLAGIQSVRYNRDLSVIFAVDRSKSIPDDIEFGLQERQENYIRESARRMAKDDRLGIIAFDGNAYVEQLPMRGGMHLPTIPQTNFRDRTDIAKAVRLAMAVFPNDTAKRLVVLTDGNENMGNVLDEAVAAAGAGVAVDIVPVRYSHRNEVFFDRMIAPSVARLEEQIRPRLVIVANRETRGRIVFKHNNTLIDLDPDSKAFGFPVTLEPGKNVFRPKVLLTEGGPHRFEAEFVPDNADEDSIQQNNVATAFTYVSSKAKALLLTDNPLEDEVFHRELKRNKIDVDMRTLDEFPLDLLSLTAYHTVILSNMPANLFTDAQQKSLASYVKDLGNGLIMTGGPESFGAGGWIGSPIEEIMPVSFEIKHKRVIPRGALVLVMHSCEMQNGNYWGEVVATKAVDTISSRDYIGVLAYSWNLGGVQWEVPLQIASNKAAVKARIKKLQMGDMPDFATTMRMAVKSLQACDAAQKHMIIISDGDPAPPPKSLLDTMVKSKITCSTVGIGFGAHVMRAPMQRIARATGGRYYPARNPRRLPQIFAKEAKVVRRPLIVEKSFQPKLAYGFSEAVAGISPDELPSLGGIVLTSVKPRVEMPLVRPSNDGDDPLLAHWQYELGKTVAFTSGFWRHWGRHWTEWEKFGKLWAQIVRWSMRPEQSPNFEVFTRLEGSKGRIIVDAVNKNADYLNFLRIRSTVVSPSQETQKLDFVQTGPGHYEAEFDVREMGQYISHLAAIGKDGKDEGRIYTGLSVPFSPEYRQLSTNEPLLDQIREKTGGRILRFDAKVDEVFSHDLPPAVSKQPVWEWVLTWLVLPLFLLDVAGRRLASALAFSIVTEVLLAVVLLFGVGVIGTTWWGILGVLVLAELIGWSIRYQHIRPTIDFFTHTVVVLGRAGERSAASLDHLKETRDKLREQLSSDPISSVPGHRVVPSSEQAAEPLEKGKRYDVGDTVAAKPAGDLQDALGGAEAQILAERLEAAKKKKTEDEQGETPSTTSQLLDARKRAKKRFDPNENPGEDGAET